MKLSILHFNALEQYPPIMNVLNTFVQKAKTILGINVFTTKSINNSSKVFTSENIHINRTIGIDKSDNGVIRVIKYFWFNLSVLCQLLLKRPDSILYYETISAFPAIFYKKFINRKCKLIAHYHEYTTVQEYQSGSGFVNRIWKFEKNNFELLDMVSHTNSKRMELFKADYPNTTFARTMFLPNYPPKSWSEFNNLSLPIHPIRFVYIGALSTETMYLKEICEWVKEQGAKVILDIYTSNISELANEYLKTNANKSIELKGGIDYFDIPNILKEYHVGLILYKGVISNHIYSEPNKLFEYLAIGLDVWLPKEIEGCKNFITVNQYPKVIDLDFNNLKQYGLEDLMAKNELVKNSNSFYCEPIYEDYLDQIEKISIV